MIKLTCSNCGRFLGEVEVIVGEVLCGNSACKGGTQFKIIPNDSTSLLRYKFAQPAREPRSKAVVPPSSELLQ